MPCCGYAVGLLHLFLAPRRPTHRGECGYEALNRQQILITMSDYDLISDTIWINCSGEIAEIEPVEKSLGFLVTI